MTRTRPAGPVTAVLSGAAAEMVRGDALWGTVVGVGVDAVDVDRFRRALDRRARLAGRLFTGAERGYARRASDPVPRLCTRFAAKEAAMKALGVGLGAFPFGEVEVVRVGLGAPSLVLYGSALACATRAGVVRWHLSLTHTDQVAMAMVIAEGRPAAGPAGADPAGADLSAGPAAKP